MYTIVDGFGSASYAAAPTKPPNMVDACRRLETRIGVPRSFQILIPRLLPALYEIRNNRGVGHVGGDVDPNQMDATAVLGLANWIMAELVRVLHGVTIDKAQTLVDSLAERRIPLVWRSGDVRRVLDPSLKLQDQVLLLVASGAGPIAATDLFSWTGYGNQAYFTRLLRSLHTKRLIELSDSDSQVQLLPPGAHYVERLMRNGEEGKRAGRRSGRRRR